MRPTTKDLAEAAGVSLATVDRVLNKRPNVSSKSEQKVNAAIAEIGFVRNPAAVSLARNKTYNFRFLLPTEGDQYLDGVLSEIDGTDESVLSEMIESVQMSISDPHAIANYLGTLNGKETDGVAIMVPESPQVRDAMSRLHERGVNVVQFLSGQDGIENTDFVGIDNASAGRTAARLIGRFLNGVRGRVMVISETMLSLDSIQRRRGFDEVLNTQFPNLVALPTLETYANETRTRQVISRILEHEKDVVAVYVLSSEARVPVTHMAHYRDLSSLVIVVHERTPFNEQSLKDEHIDAILAQNPGNAVRSALRILRARSEQRISEATQERLRIEIVLKDNL